MTNRSTIAMTFLMLAVLPGCGVSRQKVSGKVTVAGQALDHGHIEFEPLGQQGSSAGAVINDGKFEIAAERGLLPGAYRVRIYSSAAKVEKPTGPPKDLSEGPIGSAPPSAPADRSKERIAPRFNTDSVLTADVRAGGLNEFTFTVD